MFTVSLKKDSNVCVYCEGEKTKETLTEEFKGSIKYILPLNRVMLIAKSSLYTIEIETHIKNITKNTMIEYYSFYAEELRNSFIQEIRKDKNILSPTDYQLATRLAITSLKQIKKERANIKNPLQSELIEYCLEYLKKHLY